MTRIVLWGLLSSSATNNVWIRDAAARAHPVLANCFYEWQMIDAKTN
jgi:hypothetical protein